MARIRWELRPLSADGDLLDGVPVFADSAESFEAAVSFFCSEGSFGFSFRRCDGDGHV